MAEKGNPLPNKINTHKKELLEALAKSKGIVSTACESVGLSRTTFYDYVNTDPEFAQAVDDINEKSIDFVESKLFEKITGVTVQTGDNIYEQPPSDTAIIFYLKTQAKDRGYVEKTEQSVTFEKPLIIDWDGSTSDGNSPDQ